LVLERNLCFVDFSSKEPLINYFEESFWRIDSPDELTDSEKLNLISGNGSGLVDVVLYIFSNGSYQFYQLHS
jgi:hypothetical protein